MLYSKQLTRYIITSLVLLIIGTSILQGQTNASYSKHLKVGEKFPNFTFENVSGYNKEKITNNDFLGKWLVIEFWNQYCSGCLKSFPYVDSISKKFNNQLNWILIGITGTHFLNTTSEKESESIRSLYNRVKKLNNLTLPIAYDSLLPRRFDIFASPYIVIIDPHGIIKGITVKLTEHDIIRFLAGETPSLPKTIDQQEEIAKTLKVPFEETALIEKNSDSEFSFRSILGNWDSTMVERMPVQTKPFDTPGTFEAFGARLEDLYMYAFIGQAYWGHSYDSLYGLFWRHPILEISTRKSEKYNKDFGNLYAYSLTLPPNIATKEKFMRSMQNDLNEYFNYSVSIENRVMPYWSLKVSGENKNQLLKSKGGESYIKTDLPHQGFIANNVPIRWLLDNIHPYGEDPPIIDETGIKYNIDISINALMLDSITPEIISALRENGLMLSKSERLMKVLVIRDDTSSQVYNK